MEILNYRDKVTMHHLSKSIREKYDGKWVARVIPRPNFELPGYASQAAPYCSGQFVSPTSYVDNAIIFPSREAAERFIKGKQRNDYEPHQFKSEEDYVRPQEKQFFSRLNHLGFK